MGEDEGSVVAAGAVVAEGFRLADGMMAVGVPARVVGPVPHALAERTARIGIAYVGRARAQLLARTAGEAGIS